MQKLAGGNNPARNTRIEYFPVKGLPFVMTYLRPWERAYPDREVQVVLWAQWYSITYVRSMEHVYNSPYRNGIPPLSSESDDLLTLFCFRNDNNVIVMYPGLSFPGIAVIVGRFIHSVRLFSRSNVHKTSASKLRRRWDQSYGSWSWQSNVHS